MKLTGKALNAFKSWYDVKYGKHYSWAIFKDLPESMQWGIIQDWADSMGHNLMCYRVSTKDGWHIVYGDITVFSEKKTRQEARNAAIEKLNELINEQ